MTIEIKPEHEQFVQEAIRSGRYRSVADMVDLAFAALRQSTFSTAPRPPRPNLAEVLLNSPFAGADLDLERRKDYMRPVDL